MKRYKMIQAQGNGNEAPDDVTNVESEKDATLLTTLLVFVFGVLLGIAISQWIIVPCLEEEKAPEWIFGGWCTSDENAKIQDMCFYKEYVDVSLSEGGGFIRCKYSIDNKGRNITIFDCDGEDISFDFSRNQRMYINGDIDAVYDYAA